MLEIGLAVSRAEHDLVATRDADGEAVMHEGGIPGFNAILVYFPHEKLSIAVSSNSPAASAGQLAAEIALEAFRINAPG